MYAVSFQNFPPTNKVQRSAEVYAPGARLYRLGRSIYINWLQIFFPVSTLVIIVTGVYLGAQLPCPVCSALAASITHFAGCLCTLWLIIAYWWRWWAVSESFECDSCVTRLVEETLCIPYLSVTSQWVRSSTIQKALKPRVVYLL